MNTYNQTKRRLCPHCRGEKQIMRMQEVPGHTRNHEPIFGDCQLCNGEGVVVERTIILSLQRDRELIKVAAQL